MDEEIQFESGEEEELDIRVWDVPGETGYMPPSALQKYMRKTPWWATSLAFHGLIILCLYLVQWGVMKDGGKDIPMVTEITRQEEKLEEKEEKIFEKKDLVRDTIEKDLPEVDDVVIDRVFEEKVANTEAVGDPDMLSDVDLGGDGHVGTMGLGGGGMAGMFGSRGGGKKRAVAKYGGKGTLTAVDRGLEWLKRHQCPDGGWGPQDYANQCTGPNASCKKGVGTATNKRCNAKTGLTGMAILCFLGAGYTHRSGKYRKVVKKGLAYMLGAQQADGSFKTTANHQGYSNGICTLVLAEVYGMTKDQKYKKPLERAVQYLLKMQHPNAGWGYGNPPHGGDTSVSAFILMALKDASISGIKADYDKAFNGFKKYLDAVSVGTHKGLTGYRGPSKGHSQTGISMMCRQFMGMKRSNPTMKEAAEWLVNEGPQWETGRAKYNRGAYYVYYASLGMFQYGGKEWKQWNKEMKTSLLKDQIKGGCADGSWRCANGNEMSDRHGWETWAGKMYTTTFCILTLEVYYRYSPLLR